VRLKRRIDMDEAATDIDEAAPPPPQRPGRAVLPGPLDFRPGPRLEGTADVTDDAVASALASAKVYTFISIDYPGAAHSEIWDIKGLGAVGMFVFDPGADGAIGIGDGTPTPGGADATPTPGGAGGGTSPSLPPSPKTAFMFTFDFVYRILTVPNATESIATGIDADGRIVGWYVGLDGVRRGFVKDGDTFNNRDFGSATQIFGVSDDGLSVAASSTLAAASTDSSVTAPSSRSTFLGLMRPSPPASTTPATSSEAGWMQRETSTAF
jgi:hypothetical protein